MLLDKGFHRRQRVGCRLSDRRSLGASQKDFPLVAVQGVGLDSIHGAFFRHHRQPENMTRDLVVHRHGGQALCHMGFFIVPETKLLDLRRALPLPWAVDKHVPEVRLQPRVHQDVTTDHQEVQLLHGIAAKMNLGVVHDPLETSIQAAVFEMMRVKRHCSTVPDQV